MQGVLFETPLNLPLAELQGNSIKYHTMVLTPPVGFMLLGINQGANITFLVVSTISEEFGFSFWIKEHTLLLCMRKCVQNGILAPS